MKHGSVPRLDVACFSNNKFSAAVDEIHRREAWQSLVARVKKGEAKGGLYQQDTSHEGTQPKQKRDSQEAQDKGASARHIFQEKS